MRAVKILFTPFAFIYAWWLRWMVKFQRLLGWITPAGWLSDTFFYNANIDEKDLIGLMLWGGYSGWWWPR